MASPTSIERSSAHRDFSAGEWAVRVELAACYRLAYLMGWSTSIVNHISARIPGSEDHYLLNPFPFTYEEITASNLVRVDIDGNVLDGSSNVPPKAGFVVHGAVHSARPDVQCVFHTHTPEGVAVSALECGLLPLGLEAACFYEMIGYHDLEGFTLGMDERERVINDLGDKSVLILRNHGLLVAAPSIAAAYGMMSTLITACDIQLRAMATGSPLIKISPEIARKSAQQRFSTDITDGPWGSEWDAMLRRLDRLDPSYKS